MDKPVLFEVEAGVALITLNRPERRNAINQALLAHLFDCIDEIANREDISVGILTGSGKSFCSGIDLAVIATDNLRDPRGDGKDFLDVIGPCQKPIIGAINGHAITGGFEIALNCDFLIASEKAVFIDSHTKVGIHPGWGMSQLLQQAIGQRRAKQMSFTGQPLPAATSLAWGLVNEVVPHEELLPRAKQVAADICAVNQDMLATMKNLIEFRNEATLDQAFTHEVKESIEYGNRIRAAFGEKLEGWIDRPQS
jgi:enoyl-CoA hydratase